MFRFICIAIAAATLMSCTSPTDCRNWSTYQFFAAASVEDVAGCLKAGASVNAIDRDGGTALHLAALGSDNPAVIEVLVAAGADVNAQDRAQRTPLHWAALINTNPSIIRALIVAGADVNARDLWGQTPLDQAKMASTSRAVMDALISSGAE